MCYCQSKRGQCGCTMVTDNDEHRYTTELVRKLERNVGAMYDASGVRRENAWLRNDKRIGLGKRAESELK